MHSARSRVVLIVPELWAFVKRKEIFGSSRAVSLQEAVAFLDASGPEMKVPLPVEGRGNYMPSLKAQLLHHGLERFLPHETGAAPSFPAFVDGDSAVAGAEVVVVVGYRTCVIHELVPATIESMAEPDPAITAVLSQHVGIPLGTPVPASSVLPASS